MAHQKDMRACRRDPLLIAARQLLGELRYLIERRAALGIVTIANWSAYNELGRSAPGRPTSV
jgi:hypothetical protein